MMKTKRILVYLLMFSLTGCSITENTLKKGSSEFKMYVGHSKGNIIENTDLTLLENTEPDAFTGATSLGFNIDAHYEYYLKYNSIEAGIDGIINNQTFTYNDVVNLFIGERKIITTQIRMPVTYNLTCLRDKQKNPVIQLKLGLSTGYTIFSVNESGANLPDYDLKKFSIVPVVSLTLIPLTFKNNSRIGLSYEISRSGKIYNDFYQKGDMPGASYRNISLIYCF